MIESSAMEGAEEAGEQVSGFEGLEIERTSLADEETVTEEVSEPEVAEEEEIAEAAPAPLR